METIRKSIKAYVAALCLFVLLTLVLAAVIQFTSFRESWAFAGLVAALMLAALLLGMLEGKIIGRRGLMVGTACAILFLCIVLLAAGGVFAGSFGLESLHILYLLPVVAGGVGGILGVNSSK